MSEKIKLEVGPTNEKLLLGKNVIDLADETKGVLDTDNFIGFLEYLEKDTHTIFYKDYSLVAYDKATLKELAYNSEPAAICTLKRNPLLDILLGINGKDIALPQFIDLLKTLKPFSSQNTLAVLDNLNDLKIRKIVDIVHKADNRGNFVFGVTAEKYKNDYEFPESISFEIPLFETNLELTGEFTFELNFAWAIKDGDVELKFKIFNPLFLSAIKTATTSRMMENISQFQIEYFIGSFQIKKKTNEHLFKESSLAL